MLHIKCSSTDEFKAVMTIINSFNILRTDYERPEPFFIKINPEELKVEFLMTPKELFDCYNESENLRHKHELFKKFKLGSFYRRDIQYLFINFYPAFQGLMLGDLVRKDAVIDISSSEEDQKKPDIRECLRFREAYKEGMEEDKSKKISINYEQHTFFSADSKESSSAAVSQDSIHVNKHREYSSVSDQEQWISHSKNVIKEICSIVKKQEKINIFDFFKQLGDKRYEVAKQLKHQFNYLRWDPYEAINLTHYFGSIRGLDNLAQGINEKINLNGSESQHIPANFVRSELIDKLETNYFEKSLTTNDDDEEVDQYNYADTFLVGDKENNFRIKITAIPDKTQCQIKILYPEINDLNQLQNCFSKLDPYFKRVINYKTPENQEETLQFLEEMGKLAYHCYRTLPFRLGTSAIIEWMIRGVAESKNITLGQMIPNTSKTRSDWKELPQDWKAFLTFGENEYATWFTKHAFTEIKLNNEVVFDYFKDNTSVLTL